MIGFARTEASDDRICVQEEPGGPSPVHVCLQMPRSPSKENSACGCMMHVPYCPLSKVSVPPNSGKKWRFSVAFSASKVSAWIPGQALGYEKSKMVSF